MKKILSLLMMTLLCVTAAWAQTTVTFVAGTDQGETSVTKSGITVTMTTMNNSDYYQVYKSQNMTVSSAVGNITKVEITCTAEGQNKYGPGGFSGATAGSYTYSGYVGTWTGSASEFSMTASTNQVRATKIEVTYAESQTSVAKPGISFDKENPVVGENVTCTITAATGTTIKYTVDNGTEQTYTEPFTITKSEAGIVTVSAKAVLGQDESQVATATLTFYPAPVTTIANFPTDNNTNFSFNGNAIITYNDGDKYCYIKDNTGSALLYNNKSYTGGYAVGKKVLEFTGTMTVYHDLPEVTGMTRLVVSNDEPVEVTPIERTIPQITANPVLNEYTVLRGVTITVPSSNNFTITDANDVNSTIQGRYQFDGVAAADPTKTYDIEGFVGIYGTTLQFYPTHFEDVTPVAAVETPVIEFDKENPVEGETVTCTITCATEGASIQYSTDGETYQNYSAPLILTETTTVKAKAILGEDESAVATATITFSAPPVELDGMIVFKGNDSDSSIAMTESEEFMGQIEKGNNYVAGAEDMVFVYPGKEGLKIGKGSTAGSLTLNLTNTWNATKISFIARRYNATKPVTMTVNGESYDLTEDFALYEIVLNPAKEVPAITLATSQYAYLKVINIEGEVVVPQPTITLDPVPGTYTSAQTVMATVTNKPEGSTLKYKLGDAEYVDYTEAGISITETATLTVTLFDSENQELVSASGEYIINIPVTYNITLDNQPGEYSKLINVKATVEPALPEGATLKYSIDDADPVEYNASKGVTLTKSCTLTFTAYDADGTTVLATAGGEYKYIVNVFGDLNGDGKVEVDDLNIIVNLILRKY